MPQGRAADAWKGGASRPKILAHWLGSESQRLQTRWICSWELEGCGWSVTDSYCWGRGCIPHLFKRRPEAGVGPVPLVPSNLIPWFITW